MATKVEDNMKRGKWDHLQEDSIVETGKRILVDASFVAKKVIGKERVF